MTTMPSTMNECCTPLNVDRCTQSFVATAYHYRLHDCCAHARKECPSCESHCHSPRSMLLFFFLKQLWARTLIFFFLNMLAASLGQNVGPMCVVPPPFFLEESLSVATVLCHAWTKDSIEHWASCLCSNGALWQTRIAPTVLRRYHHHCSFCLSGASLGPTRPTATFQFDCT